MRAIRRAASVVASAARRRPPALRDAELGAGGSVMVRWDDGASSAFHPLWLRDNCRTARDASSRQKLCTAESLPTDLAVAHVDVAARELTLRWLPDGHVSTYCADWLRAMATDAEASMAECDHDAPPALASFAHEDLVSSGDSGAWGLTSALVEHGAALLTGVPTEPGTVGAVARLLGPVQPQIYGDLFDVRSTPQPINIAYGSGAIGPHMDLAYYESPPGIQLLHCLRFDADVAGGRSFLIDGFAAAETLRRESPEAFATLSRVPATFLKDHDQRASPVLLSYQRPHIAADPAGRVVGLFWSPPFEGPLRVPLADVADYYQAYARLHAVIDKAPRWERRLSPGELIVFSNRRMLHGRGGFGAVDGTSGGERWLQGCYVSIDDFANRYNLLHRAHGPTTYASELPPRHLGNQDWGHLGSACLPPPPTAAAY